mgnify:CR=1 FL=1
MIAAVGEPVGLKAYWSLKVSVGGGFRKAGYKNLVTTVLSIKRVRTGVMDMGRKSAGALGEGTFGMGRIQACFHCLGTVDVARERLNSRVSGL